METLIIQEKKKSVITDVILLIIFGLVPLFFLIKWMLSSYEDRLFIIFLMLVTLVFPCVVISGYIWDVKQKIVLYKSGIRLCYGRNIIDILHGEGMFSIPPDLEISWTRVTGFLLDVYEHNEPVEGGGYSAVKKYSLLIMIKNKEEWLYDTLEPRRNYYAVGLGKYKESPQEILEICEKFQEDIKDDTSLL
ncbi:hypothetical protein CEY12_05485 [Chryseobacterium sp. T16E-39]|uniref:hypothetical protein n=1 Tax=Chryseobacterium sp. T16E-39 TaxID=2015076 RepID=UPI000B5B1CCC|nr:hypothetical protein [Chryseobacterium sp. T16E-39]ASK29591.1 hypothetical protein CEY12_05485 [Chryseobacterium sp. T16E-39]